MSVTKIERINIHKVGELSDLAVLTYIEAYKTQLSSEEIQSRIGCTYRKSDFENLLKSESHFFWGAFSEDTLVAYLEVSTEGKSTTVDTGGCLQLCRIYVHPNHKGTGLGRQLIQKAEDFAQQQSFKGIWMHCFDRNIEAINFYQKCGYNLSGRDPFSILPGLERFDVVLIRKFA